MRITLSLKTADLTTIGFATSTIQHLLAGVYHRDGASGPSTARRWWQSVRRTVPAAAQPFVDLVNAHPLWITEVLIPTVPTVPTDTPLRAHSFDDELDLLRATRDEQLEGELDFFAKHGPVPPSVRAFGDGLKEVSRLADAAYALYRSCLAQDWPDMQRRLRADIAERQAVMGSAGLGTALRGVHPGWLDPSTLTVDFPHKGGECHAVAELGGRGLVLTPNLFVNDRYSATVNPWHRPTLIYPMRPQEPRTPDAADSLATLIGRGRAAALRQSVDGCTTAELAARMRVSAPTASVHAAALRSAGLISTVRDGRRVVHSVTALGVALISANPEL